MGRQLLLLPQPKGACVDGSEPGQVTIWPLVMLNVLINCPEVRQGLQQAHKVKIELIELCFCSARAWLFTSIALIPNKHSNKYAYQPEEAIIFVWPNVLTNLGHIYCGHQRNKGVEAYQGADDMFWDSFVAAGEFVLLEMK